MIRTLLVRGMLVGLVAGLVGFAVAKTVGEHQVVRAIANEEAHAPAPAPGEAPEPELVSRTVQSNQGLALGTCLIGVALGGMVALGFAYARGRVGTTDARATAALVALFGFVTVFLAPFLVYPANPPAASADTTIVDRTDLYFLMVAMSVVTGAAACMLRSRLLARLGGWNASVAGAAAFIAVIAALAVGLPGMDEIPAGFPATLIWKFRLASLATQAAIWTTLGLGFGWVTSWAEARAVAARRVPAPA